MAKQQHRTIRDERDRASVLAFVERKDLPFQVDISDKLPTRSMLQNRWQGMVMGDLNSQNDSYTSLEYRAQCKLSIGVPILCRDSEAYNRRFNKFFGHLNFEDRMDLIADWPVTRAMDKKQMTEYMESIYRYYLTRGFQLRHPDDQGR